jgi:hypothetical protein
MQAARRDSGPQEEPGCVVKGAVEGPARALALVRVIAGAAETEAAVVASGPSSNVTWRTQIIRVSCIFRCAQTSIGQQFLDQ